VTPDHAPAPVHLGAKPVVHPPARAPRLSARSTLDAWRAITPVQVRATFLLGVGLFLYHVASELGDAEWSPGYLFIFVADQIKVWPLLLAFVAVDRVPRPTRRAAYAVAAFVGTGVAAPLAVTWMSIMTNAFLRPARPRIDSMIAIGLETAMLGAATLWIIDDRRRARRAQARMHQAELERIAAQKRSIESDLQAMQARVEPRFLFETLAHVRGLYRADRGRGERMLDDLITYLRAAMPKIHDTSSTIDRELELAGAYLDIVKVRLDDRLTWSIHCADEVRGARFPPMLLLPLLDHTIAGGGPQADVDRFIDMQVRGADDWLILTIADSDAAFPSERSDDRLERIRDRLASLFEDRATLDIDSTAAGGTRVSVRVPSSLAV
jgi:hypothetical protein